MELHRQGDLDVHAGRWWHIQHKSSVRGRRELQAAATTTAATTVSRVQVPECKPLREFARELLRAQQVPVPPERLELLSLLLPERWAAALCVDVRQRENLL